MQIHHKLMIMAIVFSLILLALGQKCHAMSDYAGQGKAPITWNDLMRPQVDPSRYFATPGGGHGNHPAGGYDAPSRSEVSRSDTSSDKPDTDISSNKPSSDTSSDQTVKPDESKDPNQPHIPMVKPPKPKPEPQVKPDEHKCWTFKFKPVHTPKPKPECKHEAAKPDKKPSCRKGGYHKSECSKPDNQGPGPSNHGKDSSCGKFGGQKGDKGPGLGKHANGHGQGAGHHGGVGKVEKRSPDLTAGEFNRR